MHRKGSHHGPHVPRQSKSGEVAVKLSILVEVPDIDLHTGVVLCCDELVCPGAASDAAKCHVAADMLHLSHTT